MEETGLGPRWAPKKETRWRGVWERTGTKADGDRGEDTEGADDGGGEEEVEGGGPGAMACRRVGMAMSARAGALWELYRRCGGNDARCERASEWGRALGRTEQQEAGKTGGQLFGDWCWSVSRTGARWIWSV